MNTGDDASSNFSRNHNNTMSPSSLTTIDEMRRTQRLQMNGMSASSNSDTGQNRNSILNDINNSSDNVSQRSISQQSQKGSSEPSHESDPEDRRQRNFVVRVAPKEKT